LNAQEKENPRAQLRVTVPPTFGKEKQVEKKTGALTEKGAWIWSMRPSTLQFVD
jgi:hypothetical protein